MQKNHKVNTVPRWLSKHLQDTDLQKISQSISLAEKKTSGEIVPMVVKRSSHFSWLEKILFRKAMMPWVWNRAELEFYRQKLYQTKSGTGVLIFLSVKERAAVVMADENIAKKMPAHVWDEVVHLMIQAIQKDAFADGICHAIEKCGEVLAQHFPATIHANEMRNELIMKE